MQGEIVKAGGHYGLDSVLDAVLFVAILGFSAIALLAFAVAAPLAIAVTALMGALSAASARNGASRAWRAVGAA